MTTPQPPTRRRRWLLLPAALLFVAAVAPVDTGIERDLWRSLGDALHAPLLAAVALLTLAAQSAGRPTRRRVTVAAVISIAVAIGVEIGQPWVGRSASLVDAVNGVLGVGAALTGWLAWTRGGVGARAAHVLLSIAVLVAVSIPAWTEWRAIVWRGANHPLIGDFEHPAEAPLWDALGAARGTVVRPSEGPATHGRRSLEIVTASGGWSGVSYAAGVADWREHAALSFHVLNEESRRVVLHVRIDDDNPQGTYHARFNRVFRLEPGWTPITIPMHEIRDSPRDGPLDLERIRRIVLFVAPDEPPSRLRLDHVRLEG